MTSLQKNMWLQHSTLLARTFRSGPAAGTCTRPDLRLYDTAVTHTHSRLCVCVAVNAVRTTSVSVCVCVSRCPHCWYL